MSVNIGFCIFGGICDAKKSILIIYLKPIIHHTPNTNSDLENVMWCFKSSSTDSLQSQIFSGILGSGKERKRAGALPCLPFEDNTLEVIQMTRCNVGHLNSPQQLILWRDFLFLPKNLFFISFNMTVTACFNMNDSSVGYFQSAGPHTWSFVITWWATCHIRLI